MSARMRARVVVFAREGVTRDRLCGALDALGAEVVVARDRLAAARALDDGPVAGLVVDLDPTPRASGLGLLLAARERTPAARRVLLADRHDAIADAAYAAGLADRLLGAHDDRLGASVLEAAADWLLAVCDHAPRRRSMAVLASA
jgi:DNA-binding NtrC family response regulator